jgi:hypothetical protein
MNRIKNIIIAVILISNFILGCKTDEVLFIKDVLEDAGYIKSQAKIVSFSTESTLSAIKYEFYYKDSLVSYVGFIPSGIGGEYRIYENSEYRIYYHQETPESHYLLIFEPILGEDIKETIGKVNYSNFQNNRTKHISNGGVELYYNYRVGSKMFYAYSGFYLGSVDSIKSNRNRRYFKKDFEIFENKYYKVTYSEQNKGNSKINLKEPIYDLKKYWESRDWEVGVAENIQFIKQNNKVLMKYDLFLKNNSSIKVMNEYRLKSGFSNLESFNNMSFQVLYNLVNPKEDNFVLFDQKLLPDNQKKLEISGEILRVIEPIDFGAQNYEGYIISYEYRINGKKLKSKAFLPLEHYDKYLNIVNNKNPKVKQKSIVVECLESNPNNCRVLW